MTASSSRAVASSRSRAAVDFGDGPVRRVHLRRSDDPAPERRDQFRVAAATGEFGFERLQARGAQDRGQRDGLGVDARLGEVLAIQVCDPPPIGVQVDLRERLDDDRAPLASIGEERDLGGAQLGRGVADEDHAVREWQEGQRRGRVSGGDAPRARGVDDRDAFGEELARDGDVDALDLAAVVRVARLGDPVTDRGRIDRLDHGLAVLRSTDGDRRAVAVADERDHGRGHVVVDRAQVAADE